MGKLTDGYGNEIGLDWLQEHLFEYVDFKAGAKLINPEWTRHHLHKEVQSGRVFRGELLIMHDGDIIPTTGWSKGTRHYITLKEIERLKEEYNERPKRNVKRCEFCGRQAHICRRTPCKDRLREQPEFQDTVEKVAEFFTSFVRQSQQGRKTFTEFNRLGERKNFKSKKGRNRK